MIVCTECLVFIITSAQDGDFVTKASSVTIITIINLNLVEI